MHDRVARRPLCGHAHHLGRIEQADAAAGNRRQLPARLGQDLATGVDRQRLGARGADIDAQVEWAR